MVPVKRRFRIYHIDIYSLRSYPRDSIFSHRPQIVAHLIKPACEAGIRDGSRARLRV